MWKNINKIHFVIFSENCHGKEDSPASVKWKEVKGKPDKINELILKTTADLKLGPDKIMSSLDYYFFELIIIWRGEGVRVKLDVHGQGDGKVLDLDGQGGVGVLKIRQFSWTIFMDVICVSSLCIIQFHWHLETTNSRFWLVNILLRKFDTLLEKEMKMIKKQILW